MSKKQNILIIENQFWQFEKIQGFLNKSNSYAPIPNCTTQDDFITFIDNVRVWVNEEYDKPYTDKALQNIMEIINREEDKIDLILMDHILGGANHCLTGIDLAYVINEKRLKAEKKILPVVFLSRTPMDDKKREEGSITAQATSSKGINQYKEMFGGDTYDWIQKGYFGDDILNPEYFNQKVFLSIGKVIEKTEVDRFWERLDHVIEMIADADNQGVRHQSLKSIQENCMFENLNEDFKAMINKVVEKGDYSFLNDTIINDQLNA